MKQILVLLLSLSLFAAFTACGDDEKDKSCDGKGIYCVDGEDVQPSVQVADGSGKSILTVDDKQYRDLNANGEVDAYEDWTLPVEERVDDLLTRMSKEQKAGLLYESSFAGSISDIDITDDLKTSLTNSQARVALFRNPGAGYTAADMTTYINKVQAYVESQGLGIPFVFCCDPSTGTGLSAAGADAGYTKKNTMQPIGDWPFMLGLAALDEDETDKVREIASMHAEEYKACGFRMLLGPQSDPIGELRWARSYDTLGADPVKAGKFAKAYVQGLQQTDNGASGQVVPGVAAVLKHFPGGGTNMGGMDSHKSAGRYALFKGGNFDAFVESYKKTFEAGPLGCMPCYSIYMTNWDETTRTFNTKFEEVASSYEMTLMWDYLREECGWDGVISSDWGVLGSSAYGLLMTDFLNGDSLSESTDLSNYTGPTDMPDGVPAFADWEITETYSSWGGTSYSVPQHQSYLIYKYLQAGGHQVGNGSYTMWLNAIDHNFLSEADLDYPAGKVLEMMFKLGVFENPYRDASAADAIITANADARKQIMKETTVLVKNENVLPLSATSGTVYFNGVEDGVIDSFAGTSTTTMSEADYIILRVTGRHGTYSGLAGGVPLSFEANVYSYNYDEWRHYTAAENDATGNDSYLVSDSTQASSIAQAQLIKDAISAKKSGAKLILCVFAPRSFVFDADIDVSKIDALIVEFGIYDEQLLEFIYGTDGFKPSAKLPFCIPASDADVEAAYEDLFNDEANQLFEYGTSLTY